ncbi:MAG: hypothetical protein WCK39_10020, partial [Methanomassiliicoccales archaeon]
MTPIKLLVCEYVADETRYLLGEWGASDVELITYQAECVKRGMNWSKVRDVVGDAGESLCLVGAQCLQEAGPLPNHRQRGLGLKTDQCFDLFCEREVLEKCIGSGSYIVLPGWLRRWRQNIQSWGMDQEVARSFFRESVENIVLMVTMPYEGMEKDLEEFAVFVARPQVIIEVGLGRYHELLRDAVRETRHGRDMAEAKAKLAATEMSRANLSLALDTLRNISQLNDEDVMVAAMLNLCELLFAPGEMNYRACHEGDEKDMQSR